MIGEKMEVIFEFIKFLLYTGLIVVISKYLLVPVLRKLAESLNLKAKTVGNIAGIATSVPELLTVFFSSVTGLLAASIYNIISSNVINLVQYLFAIFLNQNQKVLQNKAFKIDLWMVVITILIPIALLVFHIEIGLSIIPIFLILFVFFYFLDNHAHKLYYSKNTHQEERIEKERKWIKGKKEVTIRYSLYLLFISISLYFIGNLLSNTLENLCKQFHIAEFVIGILLGFITSIPELITFFESQKHHQKKNNEAEGVVEATNNLLTSNLFNLFIIQSIGILVFTLFAS